VKLVVALERDDVSLALILWAPSAPAVEPEGTDPLQVNEPPLSAVAVPVTGVTAETEVLLLTAKLAAGAEPKSTAVAPVKPVPVIVTLVPPDAGPMVGETEVILGAGT